MYKDKKIAIIATDVASPTVSYVAENMNLIGNTIVSSILTTNKFEMRKTLVRYGKNYELEHIVDA
ncbi:MAG TPA: hypothetical protein PLY32_00155 [Salinivirgaceae bacterium]|nr:hypothetical protein [Salinivirgaceae bacterium]HQA75507.1 hypothetical protein [Salinivirgaceae bacterium]